MGESSALHGQSQRSSDEGGQAKVRNTSAQRAAVGLVWMRRGMVAEDSGLSSSARAGRTVEHDTNTGAQALTRGNRLFSRS